MALHWDFKKKIGMITIKGKEFNLYEGNAFLIMLHEYEENGEQWWQMYSFWVDKEHARRCLGLAKGTQNIHEGIEKIRLNKKVSRNYKDIISLLVKAFDSITIEIYSEDLST